MKLLLLFLLSSITLTAQDITGNWNGMLNAPGAKLRMIIHIAKTDTGFSATMDSPDQNVMGIAVPQVSFNNSVLKFGIPAGHIEYEGTMGQDEKIIGNFKQGANTIPLDLSKKPFQKAVVVRPQEPVKPYPYYTEDVKFPNAGAGISLAGTLSLPTKEGSFPAVILISGSGAQNRDSEVFGHKTFLVLADYLTRNGIAVLRVDDRGTFGSTGQFGLATTNDFATDVESALAYLLSRKEIEKKKIGLMGHSEGGLIAPIVAAKHKEVSFIVLLAGPGVTGDQLLIGQNEAIFKASGVPEQQIVTSMKTYREMMELIKVAKDSAGLAKTASDFFLKSLKENPAQKPPGQSEEQFLRPKIAQLTSRWMMNFVNYDPSPALEKLRCPVLAINGSKDVQVPPAQNLAAIKKALGKGGNKSATIKEIPGLNHLFQECKTGLPDEYPDIEQTFSPVALEEIKSWILKQVK